MSADPLPWSERLRRRNGLTPAGAYVDECTVTEVDGTPIAIRGSGTFTERDQEMFAEVVRAAKRRYEAETTAAEPRTDPADLPNLIVRFTADATAAMRGLNRCAAACERRCPHDLPTTMCHHCQET